MLVDLGISRNTPTPVGTTWPSRRSAFQARKHPHARGDDGYAIVADVKAGETPPRPWGRLHDVSHFEPSFGNTPTPVGTTDGFLEWSLGYRKHPHARGDDSASIAGRTITLETPPRPWGRPPPFAQRSNLQRNTPTPVGTTETLAEALWYKRKHPHARGDDTCSSQGWPSLRETPPRPWGRPSTTRSPR